MSQPIITLDIDWAKDWAIDSAAKVLIENNVKATWFVTHRSAAVERLEENKVLFELGVHPNMLAGSSHGKTEDEVLRHVMAMVPGAVSMRTHGLYQSSGFMVKANQEYGIKTDVSLFLPRATHLAPHRIKWNGANLWRIPYFWEDDSEMFESDPLWDLADKRFDSPGLKVLDFHPIHVALNIDRFEKYTALKNNFPNEGQAAAFMEKHTNPGMGPRTLLLQLAEMMSGKGQHIRDVAQEVELQ